MRRAVALAASMTLAVLMASGVVWADTFTVRNLKNAGSGSLRAAIEAANAHPGRDVITFAPNVRGTINLKLNLPDLRGELTIRGPGAGKLTIRPGADGGRGFITARGSMVTISGLKVSGGSHPKGAGIRNDGTLTLREVNVSGNRTRFGGGIFSLGARLTIENSIISGNEATTADGGGIYNGGGTAVIRNSTISGNSADMGGGISSDGVLMVEGSTFSGNIADRAGAAIVNDGGSPRPNTGKLRVRNSTFTRNTVNGTGNIASWDGGGGIWNFCGEAFIASSTVAANSATPGGGGVLNVADPLVECSGTISLRGTIVAKNQAPEAPDASGPFSSGGFNLIGNTTGATGFGPTDLQNVPSGLDPRGLRDNGGPTRTIALVSGTPPVDAVRRAACPPPATDQRGVSRPQDGNGDGMARCDIGAYERRAPQTQR